MAVTIVRTATHTRTDGGELLPSFASPSHGVAGDPTPGNLIVFAYRSYENDTGAPFAYQPGASFYALTGPSSFDPATSTNHSNAMGFFIVPDGPWDPTLLSLTASSGGPADPSHTMTATAWEIESDGPFDSIWAGYNPNTTLVDSVAPDIIPPFPAAVVCVAMPRSTPGEVPLAASGGAGFTDGFSSGMPDTGTSDIKMLGGSLSDISTVNFNTSGTSAYLGTITAWSSTGEEWPVEPLVPAPDPHPDLTGPVRVVKSTTLTMYGSEVVDGAITFEPYTPADGSYYLMAVEVSQTSGTPNLEIPDPPNPPGVWNQMVTWSREDLIDADDRQVQVFGAPKGDTWNGYMTFPLSSPGSLSPDAVIRARLYEFKADLGDIRSHGTVTTQSLFNGGDLNVIVGWDFPYQSNYIKDDVSIVLGVNPIDSATADVSPVIGVEQKSGPFGAHSSICYGQTNSRDLLDVTLSDVADTGFSAIIAIRFIIAQSRYLFVQEAVGSDVVVFNPTSAGSLLVVSARSTEPLDLNSFYDWEVSQKVRSTGGLYLTTLWRKASSIPITSISLPGATDVKFNEISGFSGNPILVKDVEFDNTVAEGDPGYSNSVHGGYTTMPMSLQDDDCVWYVAATFGDLAYMSMAFPKYDLNLSEQHSLLADVSGVDYYPDGGYPYPITVLTDDSDEEVIAYSALFVDMVEEETPPTPAVSTVMAGCPKSVRACAIRITKLNGSGVPLDPLSQRSRVQMAAFAELSLNPDFERGQETVVKANGTEGIAIIDRGCDILKGMELTLKLCGVPHPVLELLIGLDGIEDGGDVLGGMLPEQQGSDCVSPVMIELWSKNLGEGGGWIHWLIPKSFKWNLSGSLSFSNGPLDIELTGYAQGNPAWYPSLPDASKGFNAYLPGGGDPEGWPVGSEGGIVVPDGVSIDPWNAFDLVKIRRAGPLVWRVVEELPEPLDDCGFMPAVCELDSTFCGEAGADAPWPWFSPGLPQGGIV